MAFAEETVTFTIVFNDGGTKVVDGVVKAKQENNLYWMKQADGNIVAVGLYNVRYISYKDPFYSKENNV